MNQKLTDQDRAELQKAFRFGEANVRLEGLEPSPFVYDIKRRILDGEMTWEEADAAIQQHYGAKGAKSGDEAFAALDAAGLPEDFMSEADRDRRPPEDRPELDNL